jgi:glutamate dehydrogenase/leucine dehydrogenase
MYLKKDEPILIKEVQLPASCLGWVVIDSMRYGTSAGGVRIGSNVTLAEVKLLANDMTLKKSFYNLNAGGAKAGIFCPNSIGVKEREDIFFSFGRGIKGLLREKLFYPAIDMGTDRNDIEQIFKGAGINRKPTNEIIDSSYYTGISVFATLKAVAAFKGIELRGARIGIQGLGKVGINILRLAFQSGLKLVAVSTCKGALYAADGFNIMKILDLVEKNGDDFVDQYQDAQKISLEEFFEKDMDIMCPCAGIYPIHRGNVEKIKAKFIVPGCNVPADKEVERWLFKKGIVFLPGFVCNAGGVLGFVLKYNDIKRGERGDFLSRGIQQRVWDLMRLSEKSGEAPADVARSMAKNNQNKFALESKAKMKGKLNLLLAIIRNSGYTEILRRFLTRLFWRGVYMPSFVKKWYINKFFEHLFAK